MHEDRGRLRAAPAEAVLLIAWALIALCVLAFGWAEDLAAGRRPRLRADGGRWRAPHLTGPDTAR